MIFQSWKNGTEAAIMPELDGAGDDEPGGADLPAAGRGVGAHQGPQDHLGPPTQGPVTHQIYGPNRNQTFNSKA